MAKTRHPMHELRMAAPWSSDWEQMLGTERVRRCQKCHLHAFRVSDLTRAEAESLVANKEGHPCPSLYRRQDGTVLAEDCPQGVAAMQKASRWWKERVFHLFLLVLPWMIITGFIYLDSDRQRDGYYDIWDIAPFKSLDMMLGWRTMAGGGSTPTVAIGSSSYSISMTVYDDEGLASMDFWPWPDELDLGMDLPGEPPVSDPLPPP